MRSKTDNQLLDELTAKIRELAKSKKSIPPEKKEVLLTKLAEILDIK